MTESQRILNLAVKIGEDLLENGAEIFRVQDTIARIIESLGVTDYHVYVISNGIFASINENQDNAHTSIRHVPLGRVDLERIAQINKLSRELCANQITIDDAYKHLDECKHTKSVSRCIQTLAYGMGSACFCFLFGGNLLDSAAAFCLGLLLGVFVLEANHRSKSKFVVNIIGGGLVTAGSLLLISVGLAIAMDKVIIGAIIPLVPGFAFTTSIRDFFNGDYLSGSIHLIDALLTAFCIAVGVGVVMQCFHLLGGVA